MNAPSAFLPGDFCYSLALTAMKLYQQMYCILSLYFTVHERRLLFAFTWHLSAITINALQELCTIAICNMSNSTVLYVEDKQAW